MGHGGGRFAAATGHQAAPRLRLVKLGGSLIASPHLRSWLEALAAPGDAARLVVPGGGPFADAVRALQPRYGFCDRSAHRMAILAMQQYALFLAERAPAARLVESQSAILRLRRERAFGIWLPWRLAGLAADLPASWAVTSDSIALWLAARLRASELLLVKHLPPGMERASMAALLRAGILDRAFAGMGRRFRGRWRVVDVADARALMRISPCPSRQGGEEEA